MASIDPGAPVNRARNLGLLCMALSATVLSVGLVRSDRSLAVVPLGAALGLGLLGEVRGWSGSPTAWFLLQAALCPLAQKTPVWSVVSISLALGYWDLSRLYRRLRRAPIVVGLDSLVRAHLSMLAGVLVIGTGLAVSTTFLEIEAGFVGALVAGLAALAGIALMLRRPAEPDQPLPAPRLDQAERNS